jgi:hypothetical protein
MDSKDPEQGKNPATTSTFTPNYATGPTIKNTAVAAPAARVAYIPMYKQTKKGSKCFGFCCDYRRAVMMVNNFVIISGIVSVIQYLLGTKAVGEVSVDDDDLMDIVEDVYRQEVILLGVGLFTSIVANVGAYRYNIYMVGCNIIYMMASFTTSVVLINKTFNTLQEDYDGDKDIRLNFPLVLFIVRGVVMCLVIYPHVGFVYEVQAGILSAVTYPREEFSCCCVTDQRRR